MWAVWRQDDAGHKYLVSTGWSREEADAMVAAFELAGHKQMYWTQPVKGRETGEHSYPPGRVVTAEEMQKMADLFAEEDVGEGIRTRWVDAPRP